MTDDTREAGRSVLPRIIASSFLAKFLVALLLVTVVIGAVSYNTYTETSSQLSTEAETEYVGVAQQSATQIADWRAARSDTTRMLSQFEVIQSGTQAERQRFLETEAGRLPDDVYRVHLVNLDTANIVASTSAAKEGETLNKREAPWQTNELQYGDSGVFVSDAEEVHRRSLVSFVSPVETGGDAETVLVMQANLDAVATDLPTSNANMFSQVVDAQSRIVAGTQEQSDMARNDGTLETYSERGREEPALANGLAGQSGFLQGDAVNSAVNAEHPGQYVAAYAPIPGNDWVLVTHVPESAAFALVSTIEQRLAVLSLTAFVGVGLIGLVFGRGTVRALNRLTRKADELESGNLDVDLTVTRADEFGRLTASFKNMRDALRDRIQEAETARKEAEVSKAETAAVNEYLQDKAGEYGETMRRCANGDLTQRMDIDNENESMDRIAEEFNAMVSELEKTTGQLKTFSDEVAESGDVVLENADAVQTVAQDVSASVAAISDTAEDQQARLAELSDSLEEVIESLEAYEETADVSLEAELATFRQVSTVLSEVSGANQTISSQATTVTEATEQQAEKLDEVSARADQLKRYARPLGDILDRFETAAEHEFVFSGGPSQQGKTDD
jgi:methyl-accepting chemotaxis protein